MLRIRERLEPNSAFACLRSVSKPFIAVRSAESDPGPQSRVRLRKRHPSLRTWRRLGVAAVSFEARQPMAMPQREESNRKVSRELARRTSREAR